MEFFERVLRRNLLFALLASIILATIVVQSFEFQNPAMMGRKADITDFTSYYITGEMVREGRAAQAYDWDVVRQEQWKRYHDISFMPWAYPPQFTAITRVFASFPIGVSYFLFGGLTFGFLLVVLRRLCGAWSSSGLIFALPAILINARCGQNGFLTAGLIGMFLLQYRQNWLRPGVSLGAMVIKPHLAVGIAFVSLIERKWKAMAVAAVVVIGSGLLATAMLESSIWRAFFQGSVEAGNFMKSGMYPLERMTSAYAALVRLGVTAGTALIAQGVLALIAMLALWRANRCALPVNYFKALVAMCSLLVSPYNYDYDLCALTIAAALLAPDVLQRAALVEVGGLVALAWAAQSNASFTSLAIAANEIHVAAETSTGLPTYSIFGLMSLVAWTIVILRREPRPRIAASMA